MQVSTGSEQNLSVSCLDCLPLAIADNFQSQASGSCLFPNAQNIYIADSTIAVVCLSCELYKQLMIVHILSARMSILPPPILGKGI